MRAEFASPYPTPNLLDAARAVKSLVYDEFAGALRLESVCTDDLRMFARLFFSSITDSSPSAISKSLIGNQSINDFVDLCFELLYGRGRPALRVARALFEHHVNLLDVTRNSDYAQRYKDHQAIAAIVESEGEFGVEYLASSKDKRIQRHILRKLDKESRNEYMKAIASYGSTFRRQWSPMTLADRATQHGLARDYEFYRFASIVLHGSAGGTKGTVVAPPRYERPVHRTGPALSLCPLAYLYGVRFFRLTVIELSVGQLTASGKSLVARLDEILNDWPEYRSAIHRIDRGIWPSAEPFGLVSIMAVDRRKSVRWFLHDPETRAVAYANPPGPGMLSRTQSANLRKFVDNLPLSAFGEGEDWITMAVLNVTLTLEKDAVWRNEREILPDQPNRLQEPRIVDLSNL